MNEIVCSHCSVQSPENAMYCQNCGQPLRCQKCKAILLSTARVCINCGNFVPELSLNNQFHSGTVTVPTGYNRFRLHETTDVRDVDLLLSDNSVEQIRDIIPPFINNRQIVRNGSANQQHNEQSRLVEVSSELSSQPQLPVALPSHNVPRSNNSQDIWDIFSNREGKIRLQIPDLKAASKKDHTIRLTYLYLYAKELLGDDKVARIEVYKFLEDAGVRDGNTPSYISRDNNIQAEDDNLILIQMGKFKAQQYIKDIFNEDIPRGSYPSSETKSVNSSINKKTSNRGNEKQNKSLSKIAVWVASDETKRLSQPTLYNIIAAKSVQDKSLFGLYGINKAGVSEEISLSEISYYLFEAFQIQVKPDSITHALKVALGHKPPYVTYRKNSGYRITHSGIEYIEKILEHPIIPTSDLENNEGEHHENNA